MLPRANRLGGRSVVSQVIKVGARTRVGDLLFFYLPSSQTIPRLAVVVSKKISKKAVERNYLRRLVSEAARATFPTWNKATAGDIVAVVLKKPSGDILKQFSTSFETWVKKQ